MYYPLDPKMTSFKFKPGDIVTNTLRTDVEFAIVLKQQYKKDEDFGWYTTSYVVKIKLKSINELYNDNWEEISIKRLNISWKEKCNLCPLIKQYGWEYGLPACKAMCVFEYEMDEEDDEEDVVIVNDDTKDEDKPHTIGELYLDRYYSTATLKDYLKSQVLAFRVKNLIQNKFKPYNTSTNGNRITKVIKKVFKLERERFEIWGEIDSFIYAETGELLNERISIHCKKKGVGHIRYDDIGRKPLNKDETEYQIDGPIDRLRILNTFEKEDG